MKKLLIVGLFLAIISLTSDAFSEQWVSIGWSPFNQLFLMDTDSIKKIGNRIGVYGMIIEKDLPALIMASEIDCEKSAYRILGSGRIGNNFGINKNALWDSINSGSLPDFLKKELCKKRGNSNKER